MKKGLSSIVVALCLSVPLAHGATLVVTNSNDTGPGSLRGVVTAALSGDTITFDPSLNGQTITLTSGEIAIKKALIINGPGAANLTVSGNHASRIFNINAVTTISGLTLMNGQTTGDGGAIVTSANATLTGDVFTGNHSANNGGAAASHFGAAFALTDCTFSNNSSGFLSGALYTDGRNNSIVRSSFTGNTVLNGGFGAAIFNDGTLNIIQSTISNNANIGKGGVAGAIYSDGSVTVTDTTISGNSADTGGLAGGFYNAGTVAFRSCTVSGNFVGDGTSFFAAAGGGIFNESGATVTIVNSTVANNLTGAGGQGGGIYNDGSLSLNNSTIAGNQVGSGGSGGGVFSDGTVAIGNTIIARNNAPVAPDIFGALSSQGFNLIGDVTGSTGEIATDLINIDPKLGPLQNNGPFTQTMALLFGSPAIDHGNPAFDPNAFSPSLATDQRGNARMTGVIDIGAFEAEVPHQPSIDTLTSAQTLECSSDQGTSASMTAVVSDNKGHSLTVQWFVNNELKQTDQIAGTLPATHGTSNFNGIFSCGTTDITVSVTDGQSDPVTQSTTVTVADTTGPAITRLDASPNILWPPNHKMVAVNLNAETSDACDPNPKCKIISVSSNEPGAGQFQIIGDMTVDLQAWRNGSGTGRIYTITVQATDASGNSTTKEATVKVPKSNR